MNLSIICGKNNLISKNKIFKEIIEYLLLNVFKEIGISQNMDTDIELNIHYNLNKMFCKQCVLPSIDSIHFLFDNNIWFILDTNTNKFVMTISGIATIFTFNNDFSKLINVKLYDLHNLAVREQIVLENTFTYKVGSKEKKISRKENKRWIIKILYLLNPKKYKNVINIIDNEDMEIKEFIEDEKDKQKIGKKINHISSLMDIEINKHNNEIDFIKSRIKLFILNNSQNLQSIVNNLYNIVKSLKNYIIIQEEEEGLLKNNKKIFENICIDVKIYWIVSNIDVSLWKFIKKITIKLVNIKEIKQSKKDINNFVNNVLVLHRIQNIKSQIT